MAETEGQTISRTHMKVIILDMLTGGMETSLTLVEWAVSELIKNPSTLARAQQEMECVVGRNRGIKEGDVFGGYFIPPKTRLFVNVWAMGRDENVWKDERFMGSNKDVRGQDFDLLPFGTGRRGCPGISMGLSISELALAQLIHCFDWTVEDEVDMEEEVGITLPRKNPLFACPKWRLNTEYPV